MIHLKFRTLLNFHPSNFRSVKTDEGPPHTDENGEIQRHNPFYKGPATQENNPFIEPQGFNIGTP